MKRRELIVGIAALLGLSAVRIDAAMAWCPPAAWIEASKFLNRRGGDVVLRAGVADLLALAGKMPHNIQIWVDTKTKNIIVANESLGFCVTEKAIKCGLHKTEFVPTLKHLIGALNEGGVSAA